MIKTVIFLILFSTQALAMTEQRAHCLMHKFFAAFDGQKKPVGKLEKILTPKFYIGSSNTKMTKLADLKKYFSKRKEGDLYFHLPGNSKFKNNKLTLDLDYQAWTSKGRKAMILEYNFYFKNDLISKVQYKLKKKIPGSETPMSSLEDNLKGCHSEHKH